jgi:hypothetical protein
MVPPEGGIAAQKRHPGAAQMRYELLNLDNDELEMVSEVEDA